jgi:GTP diphosphokinase / guanosine-3',5'-bis(diphosphate) 3'-diphosphatase
MTRQLEEIIQKVKEYNPQADVELLRHAFEFSAKAHAGQLRHSGEPFLQHPLRVAEIITQLKLDVPSIVAGLLHDTLEDTNATVQEIQKSFGKEVARLVDGLTKISKIEFKSQEDKQAENFRKMILFMAEDLRVVLIKLADRLHNMRTLEALPEYKQRRIAQETMDIYAPLANRLGIGWMKFEMEDLCLRYLKPEVYFNLIKKVVKKREEREKYIQEVIDLVKKSMAEYGCPGQVLGRSKHLYSIYQKMERQGIPFEEVYDLAAIRIITDTKMNCYAILGMIHSLWRPVPGRFRDYIGVPKSNLYQSLHTTVIGPKGEHVEFQIRTEQMHRVAEEGIAAHWKYKEKGQIDSKDDKLFGWLRQLVEWQKDLVDSRQFMNSVRLDLIQDVVYVFTPKGDVKELVKGSTPIDFAYSIHTEIGNHCVGAKVNGKIVPLRHPLQSGDTVEVLTSQTQVPSKDWLKLVKTTKAKARIKHWVKAEEQRRSLEIGKRIFERELRRHNLSPGETFKSQKLQEHLGEFRVSTLDELLTAIGYGKVSAQQVINKLIPEPALREGLVDKLTKKIGIHDAGVKVRGVNDVLIRLSKCCNPLPGDKIIGFVTRGRGLSVHTVDCPNIDELDYDRDRIVEVAWDTKDKRVHPAGIRVLTLDRPGMLASVSASISAASANISHAEINTTEEKKAVLNFDVDVNDATHLEKILKNIRQVDGVLQAKRVRKG